MRLLKKLLRRHFFTWNTIRYLVEYRCILKAFEAVGRPVDVLLDAGAGSGEMSRLLYTDGLAKQLVAAEPTPELYDKLVKNYASIPGSRTENSALENLPFEDNEFDAILTTQVFEHIEDHEQAAREVNRVLKPGGYLIFSVPHPPEIMPNDDHFRPGYTEEEMLELWKPYGYEHQLTEYFLTLPTLRRIIAAGELPFRGVFVPVKWADREADLSNEERESLQPYGILGLFRKKL